jgi:DivIVA domain-containing protein
MAVTPEQIEGAAFSTVKRGGYRTEEVDRFLRTLADEVRTLNARVRAAEGANEDLQAASAEMATLMKDVHAQLGEKRRLAENEVQETLQLAERDAAGIIATATELADGVRLKSDRVLADAERHAELLRSDGEQRVREQAQETLRSARAELQDLVRRKHEVLHTLATLKTDLAAMESSLEATAISPDSIDDNIVSQTLIDLREAEEAQRAAATPPPAFAPAPSPAVEAPQQVQPAAPVPEVANPAPPTTEPVADAAPPSEVPHPELEQPPAPQFAPPPPPAQPANDATYSHPSSASDPAHPASNTFFSPPDDV